MHKRLIEEDAQEGGHVAVQHVAVRDGMRQHPDQLQGSPQVIGNHLPGTHLPGDPEIDGYASNTVAPVVITSSHTMHSAPATLALGDTRIAPSIRWARALAPSVFCPAVFGLIKRWYMFSFSKLKI